MKKETQLQRVIRRSEEGEVGRGTVTIRISLNGYSVTRFYNPSRLKSTLEELKKDTLMVLKEVAKNGKRITQTKG